MPDQDLPLRRLLRLVDFDVDGALQQTFGRLPRQTRSQFLSRTARAGAAAVTALGPTARRSGGKRVLG